MPKVFLVPVIQKQKLQTLFSCIQSLIPAGTQLLPWFATVCFYSYYGPWKYFFLFVVISFHFYVLLRLPFSKGREALNAGTIDLSWLELPQCLFKIPSQSLVYSSKIYSTISAVFSSLPNSNLWSIPNVL